MPLKSSALPSMWTIFFKSSAELDVMRGLAPSTTDLALLSPTTLTEEEQQHLLPEGYQKFQAETCDSLVGFLDPTKWSLYPNIVPPDEEALEHMASQDPAPQETSSAIKKKMTTVAKDNGINNPFRKQGFNILVFPIRSLMIVISAACGKLGR
ncbi:hypothetical protein BCR34DRAFT_605897 [Clohesyomyces aquaticus]|uniref:Uncharacterized protein n=1 Tax=Clohesyomyces aquaticus TaxID=1231657 RepID=A0A1Y1YTY8_9PLEO|nr:hypothetical protein BCR34DRAFT_605897 [Clohesyomyces aquaticus]